MNTLELMDACISSYSKTDRAIYESIRKFPDIFAAQSVTKISEQSGFSKPALTRFAQRLGFGGFVEFQYQFVQDLTRMRERTDTPSNAEVYGQLLLAVEERVDRGQMSALIDRMVASPHVFVMGYNLSRFPAEELTIALQLEPSVFAASPQVDIPPYLRKEDLLIIYSAVSGSSHKSLMDYIGMGRVERPHMVLVTTNSKHPLRRRFDEVIVLPTVSLQSMGHTALSDTFAFLMFNDILTTMLWERRDHAHSSESIKTY